MGSPSLTRFCIYRRDNQLHQYGFEVTTLQGRNQRERGVGGRRGDDALADIKQQLHTQIERRRKTLIYQPSPSERPARHRRAVHTLVENVSNQVALEIEIFANAPL
jgi:hypothetical protein